MFCKRLQCLQHIYRWARLSPIKRILRKLIWIITGFAFQLKVTGSTADVDGYIITQCRNAAMLVSASRAVGFNFTGRWWKTRLIIRNEWIHQCRSAYGGWQHTWCWCCNGALLFRTVCCFHNSIVRSQWLQTLFSAVTSGRLMQQYAWLHFQQHGWAVCWCRTNSSTRCQFA